jgi:hypothetical protein
VRRRITPDHSTSGARRRWCLTCLLQILAGRILVDEPADAELGSRGETLEEEEMAEDTVRWRHSLELARDEARQQGKLVLIDLFNPG